MSKKDPGVLFSVWAARVNSDTNEGRGISVSLAHFRTEAEALYFGEGKDVMGSNGHTKMVEAMYNNRGDLYLCTYLSLSDSPAAVAMAAARRKLHSALTAEELKLLGIADV